MDQDSREQAALRALANRVLTALGKLPPGGPERARAVAEARQAAIELHTVAQRNPSLAFAGCYSAGKSLLLCVLTGLPDLLAVSKVPTTGNITALRVHPAPPGTPPRVGEIRVGYLSPRDVAGLARHILDRIGTVVAKPGHDADLAKLARHQPVDPANPAAPDWAPTELLCARLWAGGNIELRSWAAELLELRDALAQGVHLLRASEQSPAVVIAPELLKDALRLGLEQALPPAPPPAWTGIPIGGGQLDAAALHATFPLIREVTVDVELPTDRWDLGGRTVELLDFPGLDTGTCRDAYLSELELPRATSVLVTVEADHPKSEHLLAFRTLLEQGRHHSAGLADSVLVAANMFDLMPVPQPLPGTIEEWADSTVHKTFRTLYHVIGKVTGGRLDRAALTSALAATRMLGFPAGSEVGPEQQAAALRALTAWHPVADGLLAGDPQHPLTRALDQLRTDAGVAHLRRMVADHLTGPGLAVWRQERKAAAAKLRTAFRRVVMLTEPAVPPPPSSPQDQARLRALRSALASAASDLRHRVDQLSTFAQQPLADGISLEDRLLDQAAQEVHGWRAWRDTLTAADKGWIRVDAARLAAGLRPAIATDDFHAPYLETRQVLREHTRKALVGALAEWTAAAYAPAHPLGRLLDRYPADRQALLARLAATHSLTAAEDRLKRLDQLVDTGLVAAQLPAEQPAPAPQFEPEGDPAFPLPYGHALAWHPDRKLAGVTRGFLYSHTDVERLYRLRRDLVRGTHHEACLLLHGLLTAVAAGLRARLAEIESALPSYGEIARVPTPPATDPGPDPSAPLKELLDDPDWPTDGTQDKDQ
ncbi:hypothetical protein AB0K51_17110 [Kitasatospora sp. NPDC049285]|uniref:hypothetical protein n=1 Tax=Kitasatospora sp. NPDC049285 TaxID=3157096 RepID=UPI00342DC49B